MVNGMKRLNRKGFTLIELVATVVVLAVVLGIGSYAITGVIQRTKEKNYELLVSEIKTAIEDQYMECKYSNTGAVSCPEETATGYEITLNTLVTNGYLKANGDNGNLINPKNDANINECVVTYSYANGKFTYVYDTTNTNCPEVR